MVRGPEVSTALQEAAARRTGKGVFQTPQLELRAPASPALAGAAAGLLAAAGAVAVLCAQRSSQISSKRQPL